MNAEEVQSRLTKYLDKMEEFVSQGIEFGKDEIPQFVNELLSWVFWDNLSHAAVCATIFAIVAHFGRVSYRKFKENANDDTFLIMVVAGCACLLLSPLLFESIKSAKTCVKVTVAPRLVLIEEIRNLAK